VNQRYAAAPIKAAYAEVAEKYHLTDGDLNAIEALPPGTVKYLDAGRNAVSADAAKGRENELNARFPLGRDLRTMPLADFMTVMRLYREYNAQRDATAFLNSIGLGAPTPTPTQQH
jgi:hypothetical protein